MKNKEIKTCLGELLDYLYEIEGFSEWWDTLDNDEEDEIDRELFKILRKRIDKSLDK